MAENNVFNSRTTFETGNGEAVVYRLDSLEKAGVADVSRLPISLRILLESLLRNYDGRVVTKEQIEALAKWRPNAVPDQEIAFLPARVVLQDFTGVPGIVDLAAMRSAIARHGGDPRLINPIVPADLVIDHSVQVDRFGSPDAFLFNVQREYERNHERYALLRWAQGAFDNLRVVPPGMGIVHQVNLEYLGRVVQLREQNGTPVAFPDTLVGTDSHTPMINGLGVLGWGVGGIEAEAVMLGQPYYMLVPEVVGVRLVGELPEGATATDLVLTITEMLRRHGVVGKFVEYFGPGIAQLPLADRATISNMSPEYGATVGLFPVDDEVLRYMRMTGREPELIELVERYYKEQGMFHDKGAPEPQFTETLELDMGTVVPSLAGPKRPQDRLSLSEVRGSFYKALEEHAGPDAKPSRPGGPTPGVAASGGASEGGVATLVRREADVTHGSVVIAAITSCTNTSNPSVMLGAGLLAKKAAERGMTVPSYVKTSLAPGSRVVSDYLDAAGLTTYLEQLGFHVVGYGCTTCIGNSGLLTDEAAKQITDNDLVAASVLSGNRNFEGRINPMVKTNYLASPILVVAYALAGTVDIDLETDPVGYDKDGEPVYLKDIWPSQEEIRETVSACLNPDMFKSQYSTIFDGDEQWRQLPVPAGDLYAWDPDSTYVQEPSFFVDMSEEVEEPEDVHGARVLVMVGDSITTDHISPAGAILPIHPAGKYLTERGVEIRDYNSYGSRRGNHEVMMRGIFSNVRLRNELADGKEGNWTKYLPTGDLMSVYDAAMKYKEDDTPVVIIAGKEYGSGSSRDWAAKGSFLLGVRAVIAESYERIHRSNLVGMGVLPLQFLPGEGRESLGLTGEEVFHIEGIADGLAPRSKVKVRAVGSDGAEKSFEAIVRIDSPVEVDYYRHGGILQLVLRRVLAESKGN